MPQIFSGIFGVVAVSLTLGAMPLAGRDISAGPQDTSGAQDTFGTAGTAINRAAKADRAVHVADSATQAQMQTISLRLNDFSDTSFLVRIPVARAARKGSSTPAPSMIKSGDGKKMAAACEPVVSVLTELANRLEPGRCVT
jgi:hypothetical protein